MINIFEKTNEMKEEGYSELNAQAKLCQDIVLDALSKSDLSRNVTIIEGINISITREIEELKQQDYHGKRVYIQIADTFGNMINSKIDFGVHNKLQIEQEEYCFDIGFDNEGASLLINSKEQMLTEKLRSILKFGVFSTRYKDIFDICYLLRFVDKDKLLKCFEIYIYNDEGMKENTIEDVVVRVQRTFSDKRYIKNLETSKKNWLDISTKSALKNIVEFLKEYI